MAVFGEQLEKQKLDVPLEHPINILMEEHGIMLQVAEKLSAIANRVQQLSDESYIGDALHHLQHVAEDFQDSGKTLSKRGKRAFSQLRKARNHRGASNNVDGAQPVREKKKQLSKLIENYNALGFQNFKKQLAENAKALNSILPSHFFKENNILFQQPCGSLQMRNGKK